MYHKADIETATADLAAGSFEDVRRKEICTPPMPYKLGFLRFPHYRSTYFQVFLAGVTNLLAVGMFGVLADLGGAGQIDATLADQANIILYVVFAVMALFSGTFINYFGPRITLSIGALGYAMYGAAFWCYNHTANHGFVLFSGVCCGFGAGLLWVACGTIMMSYPTETQKGRFVSGFFFLSFFGAVIGGIIPVAQNSGNNSAGSVNDGTYAALTILMIVGSIVALFICDPSKIIRTDGTRVVVEKHSTISQEFKNIYLAIKREPFFIFFMPFAFAALFYNPYQSNDFNSYFFTVYGRSVNGLLYAISQCVGALSFGLLLDIKWLGRRKRAIMGWIIVVVVVVAVNTCGFFPMQRSKRGVAWDPPMGIHGNTEAKYMTLYFFYGWQDGMFQAFAFWLMGCLSNDPLVLSMYAGFFKVFGALGACIAFAMDERKVEYSRMFGSYYGVLLFGALFLGPLILTRVKDTLHTPEQIEESADQDVTKS